MAETTFSASQSDATSFPLRASARQIADAPASTNVELTPPVRQRIETPPFESPLVACTIFRGLLLAQPAPLEHSRDDTLLGGRAHHRELGGTGHQKSGRRLNRAKNPPLRLRMSTVRFSITFGKRRILSRGQMTEGLSINGAIFGRLVECSLVTATELVKVSNRARGTEHPSGKPPVRRRKEGRMPRRQSQLHGSSVTWPCSTFL